MIKWRIVLVGQTDKDIELGEELLSRLMALDECAWSAFYRLVAPRLGKFAEHHGAVDSEDVIQDAMLRFFTLLREERLRLNNIGDAQAYLTTLVRNLIIDRFRRDRARCRDKMVPLDEFMIPVPAMAPLIVEASEALELQNAAHEKALTSWSGKDRTKVVYAACVLQGRSVSEVAADLGIPPNTVSQMKRRGLKKVRQLLEKFALA